MMMRLTVATVLIVGAAACAGNQPEGVAPRGDLFGSWQLDRAASDTLQQESAPEPSRGGVRVGGRFPGRGGMPEVLRTMEEEAAEMRRVYDSWARGNERMTIDAASGVVRVEYADSARLELVTGKKLKHDFRGFEGVESTARWKGGSLEIEHRFGRVRLTETFTRAPQSPRLIVTTQLKGGVPRPKLYRRIYVAANQQEE